jgi:LEA14-like dessication related protein
LLTLASVLFSCVKIEEPEFREIRDFHIDDVSLQEVQIQFGMAYFNPNEFSVTVKETAAKVYLDSAYLGEFKQDSLVEVKENDEFVVTLSGSLPVTTFFQMNLKDLLKRQVLIHAEGATKVGKAGVFITKKINYQGRHRLDEAIPQ